MADILKKYGIKEVADVTFYKLVNGKPTVPVLFLDTLKVSSIEQTAENVAARGGQGNPKLIMWDYNKEITLTLEDALFSAKSMAIMFGDVDKYGMPNSLSGEGAIKSKTLSSAEKSSTVAPVLPTGATNATYYDAAGTASSTTWTSGSYEYVLYNMPLGNEGFEIEINSNKFPGTYYITGDTLVRDEDGSDSLFQFVLPKAKINSEVTLTLEAEGDPTTFNMSVQVLKPAEGPMMKLVKYEMPSA